MTYVIIGSGRADIFGGERIQEPGVGIKDRTETTNIVDSDTIDGIYDNRTLVILLRYLIPFSF